MIIDLSQPLFDACPNCPAHPPVEVRRSADHDADDWRMEHLNFASHSGSHIDAPLHKIKGGQSLDDLALETFVGAAYLADLRPMLPDAPIDAALLESHLPADVRGAIVLLATGWGDKRAHSEEWLRHSPCLTPSGAAWLVEHQVRGVGIDHYSIGGSREPNNAQTHQVLLGAGLWIVEELRFPPAAFELPQPLQFWALPINLHQASGAPCRPVLVVEPLK